MNKRKIIENRLLEIFKEIFDDQQLFIYDEMSAQDIDEWDSVTHISLVLAIESEFNLLFKAAEIGSLENVGQMIDLILIKSEYDIA